MEEAPGKDSAAIRHARLAGVLRNREFAAVWVASVLSVFGDQLARVALAGLIYSRTSSAFWAAGAYALTFVPAVVGGAVLGPLADRFPRRSVMVCADLVRAALFAAMAVPSAPTWLVCVLLVIAVAADPVHQAAQTALVPELVPDAQFEAAQSVRVVSAQAAQLAGFATAGVVVTVAGPSVALLVDAGTFLVAAAVLRIGVLHRPPAAGPSSPKIHRSSPWPRLVVILSDPRRRPLLLVSLLIGCYVVPEGLAVPLAAETGAGAAGLAALLIALPLGGIIGAWAMGTMTPDRHRTRLIMPLAAAAGLPLVLGTLTASAAVTAALWTVSGACAGAFLLQAQVDFVRATPADERGQAIGLASAGLLASQGLLILASGAVAALLGSATTAVALAGALGAVLALAVATATGRS